MALGKAVLSGRHSCMKTPLKTHRPSRQALAEMRSTGNSFRVKMKAGRNNSSSGTYNIASKNEIESITQDSLLMTQFDEISTKVEPQNKWKFAPKQRSQDVSEK